MKVLLTGCAGFIGSHTLDRLLADNHQVIGVDNFDPYYDRSLKDANIAQRLKDPNFELIESDLAEPASYKKIKSQLRGGVFDVIIHLAAKAGVRPSIENPTGYQRANVLATQNLLEFAKDEGIKQFVFASSSSVYGENPNVPWSESNNVSTPISPYACTKVCCELMGHVYSHLYGIRVIGLRFFTVYGPRQRPDLAINKFVRLIEANKPIPVFGDGSTRRDYTYIADIVEGIIACVSKAIASGAPSIENGKCKAEQSDGALPSYAVINLGNEQTITLSEMIETIEDVVSKKAIIDRQPQQPGDVPQTWADVSRANELFGYKPSTTFKEGVTAFYKWQKIYCL